MRKLPVSWAASRFNGGGGRNQGTMRFKMVSWEEMKRALSKPHRVGRESYDEYLAWDKEKQLDAKDAGYYIIGEFHGNVRHNSAFARRATVTLDIDYPGADFESRLGLCFGASEYFWHTSRKHCADAPRIRVHLPLQRDVTTADEYEALARLVASWYDIEVVDRISYVAAQMMFFPSRSADGEFRFGTGGPKGLWLDPDAVLFDGYMDWTDRKSWPRTDEEVPPETRKDKIDSPLTKPGVIGAFCRAYSITRCLEELIPGIYEPTGEEGNRWRYHAAEGGGGAIVYDNGTVLYSHHTNHDPAAARSNNAFDLVRIHKFTQLDALEIDEQSPTRMPSYLAMVEFAMSLPDVVAELGAIAAFEGMDDEPDAAGAAGVPARPLPRAGTSLAPLPPASDSLDDELLEELPDELPAAENRPALTRTKLRAMMAECEDADALVDAVLPALAGAAIDQSVEALLLRELSDRHKELTGRGLELRALRKSLAELRKKIAGPRPLQMNGHVVPAELLVTNEDGRIVSNVLNMREWLRAGFFGVEVVLDRFTGRAMMSPPAVDQWRQISTSDVIDMRIAMEKDGFTVFGGGNDLIRMAIDAVSREKPFDSAQAWLGGQIWDGTPRVLRSLATYWGAPDNEYTRGVALYLWTALAGRVMQPGVKADMMPILVGAQGLRKSSSVEALAPARDFFTVFSYRGDDAQRGRSIQGKLVAEFGELRGFQNEEDEEGLKTFLARTFDEWRPLWEEDFKPRPRRTIFVGTTDKKEFLRDMAGNRRYLPVAIRKTAVEAIQRDCVQLWAEAAELFTRRGVAYQVESLAAKAHEEYSVSDLWDNEVLDWLDAVRLVNGFEDDENRTNGECMFTLAELLKALQVPLSKSGKREEIRIARILNRYGYEQQSRWYHGRTLKVWSRKAA